jgi:hypothetical protein
VVGAIGPNKKASADLRDLVAFVSTTDPDFATNYEDEKTLNQIEIDSTGKAAAQPDPSFLATADATKRIRPYTNLGPTNDLVQSSTGASRDVEATNGSEPGMTNFQQIFENGVKALKYISRPICTLEEYISFIFGGLSVDFLLETNQIATPRHDFGYVELIGKAGTGKVKSSAVYYERIFNRTPGPPTERPTDTQSGVLVKDPADRTDGGTQSIAVPNAEEQETLPNTFPQTRLNWSEILLAYRQQILERQSPQR